MRGTQHLLAEVVGGLKLSGETSALGLQVLDLHLGAPCQGMNGGGEGASRGKAAYEPNLSIV